MMAETRDDLCQAIPDPAYPPALETQEAALVKERRNAAGLLHDTQGVPLAREMQEAALVTERRTSTEIAADLSVENQTTATISTGALNAIKRWTKTLGAVVRRIRTEPVLEIDKTPIEWMRLPDKAIGFGLSGGGIRSATFMLGVFQALAEARLVGRIDFLSTVSGGGYFGAFLGRLFSRPWINTVDDVERVLRATDRRRGSRAQHAFRWLRDNGRYLAPRGSGDVLVLGAVLLRNWVAVHVVLVTTVLAGFLGLQIVRRLAEESFGLSGPNSVVADFLVCQLPGQSYLWWSPWVLAALIPLVIIAVPTGWAYWLVVRHDDGRVQVPPWIGVAATLLFGLAGMVYYWPTTHHARWAISTAIFGSALLAIIYWRIGERTVRGKGGDASGDRLRSKLSRWVTTGLVWSAIGLAWALIDTFGATFYATGHSLRHWAVGVGSAFAGVGAFAHQLVLLLAPTKADTRPRIPFSILAWIGAIVAATVWLLTINVASHAIAWDFKPPIGAPAALMAPGRAPQVLGADHLTVQRLGDSFVVHAANVPGPRCEPTPMAYRSWFIVGAFLALILLSWLFGHTRTFANLSSIHAFYAARLTRTYLGASNEERFRTEKRVTDTDPNDDCAGDAYWRWPQTVGTHATPIDPRPYQKGGPLHIVNTTINETADVRTGVQNQDRKGTGLAIGPCGLSVGIRHHLVSTPNGVQVWPQDGFQVFNTGPEATAPDPLSLGKWTSVSGAAFSAAAGANTTVPMAILAGLFNVRLGYWWDSGTPAKGSRLERVLPVQAALYAETLARTRGTAGRLWNLSDGGHFENMGGYELIRRRLPLIVIIDAEADPDYTFGGLSDLVRKARLDFGAEVTFLTQRQLSGADPVANRLTLTLPGRSRDYFGNLESLRRGKWLNERMPFPDTSKNRRFTIEVERSRVSSAHAALAHVTYDDKRGGSWLLYVKATLKGDEPEDVCQYHRSHPDFPQETTTDQFFDEGQWESYRRLGLHIGHRVLSEPLFTYLQNTPAP